MSTEAEGAKLVRSDWTRSEVEATVASYLAMLTLELRGDRYSKTDYRRRLSPLLRDRSDAAIERKHQNISAALIAFGYPYIRGYLPLRNYQQLLAETVATWIARDPLLLDLVEVAVDSEAHAPRVGDPRSRWVDPPKGRDASPPIVGDVLQAVPPTRRMVDYLGREARNASLGRAGELFALELERTRLITLGLEDLAGRVEHVAVTYGDGAGFDIRSFEEDGSDRLVEVKTTAFGRYTPFYLSQHELEVSRSQREHYHLYRVFDFRVDPRLFALHGALDTTCRISPTGYRARVA